MTRRRLFASFAIAVWTLFVLATPAAAHTATPGCGSITAAQGTATVDVIRTDLDPDLTVFDDAPGNGTFSVPAGVYTLTWDDGYSVSGIVVTGCVQPTPTPTPQASPTPTPPQTCEQLGQCPPTPAASPTPTPAPSPTPSPAASPTPTPEATPTAAVTIPPDDFTPTLPPTSTDAATGPQGPDADAKSLGLIVAAVLGLFVVAVVAKDVRSW